MIRLTIPSSGYDVVVVGARCAGAATAMLLARAGHRVLMVDRGRYGTDTLSTHALMRGAVIQLHRWNILPAVIAADTTPVRQATFFYGDESVSIPVAPRDGIEALYAPRRYVLDRLLVDAAGAAGADIVYGVRIKDLQRAETGRVIGVVLEDESGDVHHVASRVVVGADGLRSTVARLVGAADVSRGTTRERHHVWTLERSRGRRVRVVLRRWSQRGRHSNHRRSGLRVGIGAGPGIHPSVCTPTGQRLPRTAVAGGARSRRAGLRESSQNDDSRSPLHGFPGHAGFFRHAHGPGWALVGDAGYFKDPMTAHGITDALRDAALLASAIDAGSDDALADYQEQRDAASLDLFETTDAIASFNWNLNTVRPLHEALAKSMSREVKRLVGA